ncbi:MAG: AraC family transcriptional regulator [Gemmiger sp.]|nr:AraC family transcriptional regulator [Gemmiger sp.]
MDTTQNIELFKELVRCGTELSLWCYDDAGQLLSSNSPEEALFSTAFSAFGGKEKMLAHAQQSTAPVQLGSALGITWGAAFEWADGRVKHCYVLGPVFFSDVSMKQMEHGFNAYNGLELSVAWKKHFVEAMDKIPVSHNILFARYLLMLHYCLTGEHLRASDLVLGSAATTAGGNNAHRDRHKVWMAEQALLQMVRTGDLNYKDVLNNSMLISNGVPVQGRDPLRQGKISDIVFISITCRAAIEGGLSPEEAYALGDTYIQSVESATSLDELRTLPSTMYDDFIRRVHKCRTNPSLSRPVQQCVDYIEMHLDERIRAEDLAALVGYSEYYITRKFREETHYFINDYIKFAKIERAKVLLTSTDISTLELAERLGFATRSYFSQCFKQVAGVSPAEYRAKLKKK